MIMARIDAATVSDENVKQFNVLARAMYKKGLLTDENIISALRQYKLLKDLGLMAEEPNTRYGQSCRRWYTSVDQKRC